MLAQGALVNNSAAEALLSLAASHPCARHPLFAYLAEARLSKRQVAALLRNYDAHASVLRRLLLKAATIMPEEAVGYVLENVRNEYGNGDYSTNHRQQLVDVALAAGVSYEEFEAVPISTGVTHFIAKAPKLYFPLDPLYADAEPPSPHQRDHKGYVPAAVSAGAITGTELLAIEEFRYMQVAFDKLGLAEMVWFNHVTIEQEHTDESLALALHFCRHYGASESVLHGLNGILDANLDLYDGMLEAVTSAL